MPTGWINSQALTVYRGDGSYGAFGVWDPGSESSFVVRGVIQPWDDRDLALLPEGERTRDHRSLHCLASQPALITAEPDGPQADQVSFDGFRWEVHKVGNFDAITGRGLAHRRYRITRIAVDEEDPG